MAKFRYVNLNPNGEHRNDCVTRAISLASGLDYSEVRRKLRYTSRLLDCIRLCWSCYSFFITQLIFLVLPAALLLSAMVYFGIIKKTQKRGRI